MKESVHKTYDDLPLFLNANLVAQVLGVSRSSTYELMHEPDFPVLRVGSRMVVPKEQFIQSIAYGWFQAAAIQGHTYAQFFKERMEQGQPGPPGLLLSATQLLHHMGDIFRDNVPEDSTSTGLHIDHKRLQALQEKRIALGHRPDDHVETQNMGGMTMG